MMGAEKTEGGIRMRTTRVTVLPYDRAWQQAFENIKTELDKALEGLILAIEHVGSTSVPGLSAKPCIDLDVVIEDRGRFDGVKAKLEALGYCHEGDLGIPDREAFGYKGKDHLMKHHLYVCPRDSDELRRHITFRNYLRSHPEAAARYGAVKEEAARRFPEDIDGYMDCKAPCIAELYALCGLE